MNVDLKVNTAFSIDEKNKLFNLKPIDQEISIDQKASISVQSQLIPTVQQLKLEEKEDKLLSKKRKEDKSNISIEENKSIEIELQNVLNTHTSLAPSVLELKAANVDLVHQKALNVGQNEINLKEQQFISKESLTSVCKTDFTLNEGKIISETIVSNKENQLKIYKPNESIANLEQLNEKSIDVSQTSLLDTCKKFEKTEDLKSTASVELIATNNTINIQQNLVNENEKPKKIEKPKKKKLRISVLTKEAIIIRQLDECQKEEKLEKFKVPEKEKVEQNLIIKQAKNICTNELLDSLSDVKLETLNSENVNVNLLTNKSVNILENNVLNKEDLRKDVKLVGKKIKPKIDENTALQVNEVNEQLNEDKLIILTKNPGEATINLIDTKVISKSKEQLLDKEIDFTIPKTSLAEVKKTTIPNLSFNVSLDEHEEKENKFETKPLKPKKAKEKVISKKQNSLDIQENKTEEIAKLFDAEKLDEKHGELKLEQNETVIISLQQETHKENIVKIEQPKLVAAKKRKEFRKSRSLAVQKAESLEKEDKFEIEKVKLGDTKESIETFSSSIQEQYYSFDNVDEFMPEQINFKTGNVTIEKYVTKQCDQVQPNEKLNKLDELIKPKEHKAKENLVEETDLKQAKINKVESFEVALEDHKKQTKLDKEESESISEKTKITIQKRKKKIITEDGTEETTEEVISQPSEKIEEEEENKIIPRKITIESIQNEVDVKLLPKQDIKLDSKKLQEKSQISIDEEDDKFLFKPVKKEYTHTFERDGDKIRTIESESETDLHSKITIETKKKRTQHYEEESEIEKQKSFEEKEEIPLSTNKEVDDSTVEVEKVKDVEIDLKIRKKPKFVERFDLKPGKTEPVYYVAKEESTTELCTEKTDELDQPSKLEKHASTSIENLKNIQIDETKTEEKEIELKPKQKKRVKIIIPTKEARQLNEVDQSITAIEIKADKYFGGMYI